MTEAARNFMKDWVVPLLAAVLTAATIYGWAFEAQFTKEVEKHKPEMRREVQQMLSQQSAEISRDRIEVLSQIEQRLTRIETLLEGMQK